MVPYLLIAAWLVNLAQTAEPEPSAGSQPVAAESQPDSRTLQLSARPYPAGVSNESEYAVWLHETAGAMAREARDTDDALLRIERLLGTVNFILTRKIEPPATRYLLRIAEGADFAALTDDAADALALLDEAAAAIQRLEPAKDLKSERIEELDRGQRMLEAFARAFAAIAPRDREPSVSRTGSDLPAAERGSSAGDDDLRRLRRQAAAALAPILEDMRPAVAVAAVLWQSVLYGLTEELDRAMRLLPPASRTLSRATAATELFIRLQRCRYVARQGGYAAAVAMLLGLAEQCADAFAGDPRKDEAVRVVELVRMQTLLDWQDALPAESEAERTWCRETAAKIEREQRLPGTIRVLRLEEAIPPIAGNGAVPSQSKEPPPKPAIEKEEGGEPNW
jgi:hypothetical protein